MTWSRLATQADVADVTLRAIRRGDNVPSPLTKRRIEDALQWRHGSVDAVLAGGEPTPLERREPPKPKHEPTMQELAEELRRAREEIEQLREADERMEGEIRELRRDREAG